MSAGASATTRFGSWREHLPFALLAAAAVSAASVYAAGSGRRHFLATGQTVLGVAAALGLLFGFVYAARKHGRFGRFRRARPWYLAHVWLGVAGLAVACLHSEWRLGGGVHATLLLGFAAALASGSGLATFHHLFQAWMFALEREHLLPEDIDESRERLAVEIDELLAASGREAQALARRHLLRPLGRPATLYALLGGRAAEERLRSRLVGAVSGPLRSLPSGDREVLERVLERALERRGLDLQSGLHRLRRGWIGAHVLLSTATLGLLVVHVAVVVSY